MYVCNSTCNTLCTLCLLQNGWAQWKWALLAQSCFPLGYTQQYAIQQLYALSRFFWTAIVCPLWYQVLNNIFVSISQAHIVLCITCDKFPFQEPDSMDNEIWHHNYLLGKRLALWDHAWPPQEAPLKAYLEGTAGLPVASFQPTSAVYSLHVLPYASEHIQLWLSHTQVDIQICICLAYG